MMPAVNSEPATAPALFKRLGLALLEATPTFPVFFREAWKVLEPHKPLVESWHIDLIAEHLQAVDMGQIQNLRISIPPRHLKSNIVTVAWPAWSWIDQPWIRWIFSSYAAALAEKHSMDRRAIIQSPSFQKNWGDMVIIAPDQNRQDEFHNLQRGTMVAVGTGGSITGKGGDRIVADDPQNPEQAESAADRKAAVRFWTQTLSTRLDDKKRGIKVVVAQRLHQLDIVGAILKEMGWTHLVVPAISEKKTVVQFPISRRQIVREEGDILCPEREDAKVLDAQKLSMGTRGFNAQYQQNPSAEEGGFFKRAWWKFWKELPEFRRRIWFWDTAVKDKQTNDFSCGMYWGETETGWILVRRVKERLQYPQLRRRVKSEAANYPADEIVVEDKSSGEELIQDLRADTNLPVIAFLADKDKVFRANLVSPLAEAGRVWLPDPENESWVNDYIDTMENFPNVEHDDEVDATTGALMRLTGKDRAGVVSMTVV